MDTNRFWALIEAAKTQASGEVDVQGKLLTLKLVELTEDEIIAFDQMCYELHVAAYTIPRWTAAEIVNAGASDDGFFYSREWLIFQGRDVYERALRDPETLADAIVINPDWLAECECCLSAARDAYRNKTGRELPWRDYRAPEISSDDLERFRRTNPFPRLNARADARYHA